MSLNDEIISYSQTLGLLTVKGNDGRLYPVQLSNMPTDSDVSNSIGNAIANLGLEFLYDRSDEPKPIGDDFIATDASSEAVTTHAAYDYSINDASYTFVPTKAHECKDGEVYVYPDDKILSVASLPCTLKVGHELKYKVLSSGGYYYAHGRTTTLEITEPGTYQVEMIALGGWSLGTPPPWYAYTAEVVVEANGSSYKITIKDFTFYTHDAAVKYREWKNRPTATTLKLVSSYNANKTANITYLTDYIKSLEQRIAALEAIN